MITTVKKRRAFWDFPEDASVMTLSEDGKSVEVMMYSEIGFWGIEAEPFVKELAKLDVEQINVRVNSPGGDVYEGVAIMNALRRHNATVNVSVDGIAASAASFIIMAADSITMSRGSEIMIHDAWSMVAGSADDMRTEAGHLDRISDTIAGLYAERAGGDVEGWRNAMKAESWYSAQEAVDAGLADKLDTSESKQVPAAALNAFTHRGRKNAPAPWMPERAASTKNHPHIADRVNDIVATVETVRDSLTPKEPPAAPLAGNETPNQRKGSIMDELIKGLRERLGISAEADLDTDGYLAALDEALAEAEEEVTVAEPVAVAKAEGTVTMDEEQHQKLLAEAAEGRAARAQKLQDDRLALVNSAIADGRIAPARRDHWVQALAADPGAEQVLASLKPGLVPLEAVGFVGGVDEASDEDSIYSKIFPSKEA